MQALSQFEPRRGRIALLALVALLAATALALVARPAGATPGATCPGFRVLHNDRIGAAVFPAGTYTVTDEGASLTCKSSAELFARFLEDYDGVLPTPWKVTSEGSGKAAFGRGAQPGFSVSLTKKEEEGGTNPDLGTLCPNTFTVNSTTQIETLRFTKGAFLIYLPQGSGLACSQASRLFTKFLGSGGKLPSPWKLTNQTATFYKPSNPTRSACFFAWRMSTGSGVPGTIGTPLRSAIWRAAALSPIISIASADGPTNVNPASFTASANRGARTSESSHACICSFPCGSDTATMSSPARTARSASSSCARG